METVVIWGLYKDPSIQIIPTLGPKAYKYYLPWATWILRVWTETLNPKPSLPAFHVNFALANAERSEGS